MLPTQYTATHTTIKASMCPSCESYIKCATHTKDFSGQTLDRDRKPSRETKFDSKHYLIMNESRDDDRILQIATERSDSCGDRRHATLLTTHSTYTQQTQYTDNKATLNEKQFFLLC